MKLASFFILIFNLASCVLYVNGIKWIWVDIKNCEIKANTSTKIFMFFKWRQPILRVISTGKAVGDMPVFQWMKIAIWMFSWCNAVGVVPIFQWTHLSQQMFSFRNSVRVVLLIARGWRGTSLPRVSVRKGIQRHRCWAFSMKAWV